MTWGEVSKWAKEKGFKISRKDGEFSWVKLDSPETKGSESSLEDAVTAIFNEISGHKWVEYQKARKSETVPKT